MLRTYPRALQVRINTKMVYNQQKFNLLREVRALAAHTRVRRSPRCLKQ